MKAGWLQFEWNNTIYTLELAQVELLSHQDKPRFREFGVTVFLKSGHRLAIASGEAEDRPKVRRLYEQLYQAVHGEPPPPAASDS
jgi:hypothetical protein